MTTHFDCPVCRSDKTEVIQPIYLQRQEKTTDQIRCNSCESFFHFSGYREDETQWRADTEFQIAHPGLYRRFVKKITKLFPRAKRCLEIGCGTGELLLYLRNAGLDAIGVDVNPVSVAEARKKGLDARVERFVRSDEKFDLIFAIDVLEHCEAPRTIIADAVSMLDPNGAISIRVPTVDRHQWEYLDGAPHHRGGFDFADPFRDNSVHITHFSTAGLLQMMTDFGFSRVGTSSKDDIHIFMRKEFAPLKKRGLLSWFR